MRLFSANRILAGFALNIIHFYDCTLIEPAVLYRYKLIFIIILFHFQPYVFNYKNLSFRYLAAFLISSL